MEWPIEQRRPKNERPAALWNFAKAPDEAAGWAVGFFCVPRQGRSLCIFRPSYRVHLKEHCVAVQKILRPIPNPTRKAAPLDCWEAMDFFNAPGTF